ncbi:TAXI family TRAP transporter solute-binding subunit [Desulfopila sp. IMCC35006]|nr:TAXI family TRAP transporter solute-binding subunit [Desulfopila sp. IMCC35006]
MSSSARTIFQPAARGPRSMKKNHTKLLRIKSTLKELVKIYGLAFFIACLIIVGAYQFVAPAPPKTLTIATAGADGAYFAFAQQYRKLFARQNIDLQIIETSGSVENLKLLAEKKVEVAFLQGGIGTEQEYPGLRGLASLYLEPLWIFVKKDLEVGNMHDLVGKRVAIGPEGSGTRHVVMQMLHDNNLSGSGKLTILPLSGKEGAKELLAHNIDALFVVTRAGTPLLRELLLDPRVQLVNLVRAEAYTRLHTYLSHIVLPEGVLDMERNIPARDIHLVAPAATLVANDVLHPALTDLLMQVTAAVHKDTTILTAGQEFPSPEKVDLPLNKEAERFYRNGPPFLQRYLPFWAASLVDRLKVMLLPLVALILPLTKVLPPTYRWRMRSRIYRWYDELHELDRQARETAGKSGIASAIAGLDAIENDVRQVAVPLSYSDELYNLRLHIEMLRNQLSRQAEIDPGA